MEPQPILIRHQARIRQPANLVRQGPQRRPPGWSGLFEGTGERFRLVPLTSEGDGLHDVSGGAHPRWTKAGAFAVDAERARHRRCRTVPTDAPTPPIAADGRQLIEGRKRAMSRLSSSRQFSAAAAGTVSLRRWAHLATPRNITRALQLTKSHSRRRESWHPIRLLPR